MRWLSDARIRREQPLDDRTSTSRMYFTGSPALSAAHGHFGSANDSIVGRWPREARTVLVPVSTPTLLAQLPWKTLAHIAILFVSLIFARLASLGSSCPLWWDWTETWNTVMEGNMPALTQVSRRFTLFVPQLRSAISVKTWDGQASIASSTHSAQTSKPILGE
jgi:hypothetical protein